MLVRLIPVGKNGGHQVAVPLHMSQMTAEFMDDVVAALRVITHLVHDDSSLRR